MVKKIRPKRSRAAYLKAYAKRYFKDPKNRLRRAEHRKRTRLKNPGRHPVYEKVARALASGRLKKKPCEKCGAKKVQAHHDDYSKPLSVRWLCQTHHAEHHAKARGQ